MVESTTKSGKAIVDVPYYIKGLFIQKSSKLPAALSYF